MEWQVVVVGGGGDNIQCANRNCHILHIATL